MINKRRHSSPNKLIIDRLLLVSTFILIGIGLIYSIIIGSPQTSQANFPPLTVELLGVAAGVVLMGFCMFIDYRIWRKMAYPLLLLISILLSLAIISKWVSLSPWFTLIFSVGKSGIPILVGLVWVIYLARLLGEGLEISQIRMKYSSVLGLGLALMSVLLFGILLACYPVFRPACILFIIPLSLLFVWEWRPGYAIALVVISIVGLYFMFNVKLYGSLSQIGTVPVEEFYGAKTFPLLALARGGWNGVVLRGEQSFFSPKSTGFVLAAIGENFGFIGALVIIVLFGCLIWRGFDTAATAPDRFGCFLAIGITVLIALQAMGNMAIITGMLPLTGGDVNNCMGLPFVHLQGLALLVNMAGVGILQNIRQGRIDPATTRNCLKRR